MPETAESGGPGPMELGSTSLQTELDRPGAPPLLIDFWAPWCGTCRLLAPALDKVAAEQAGSLRVGKVDVAAHPELAERFDVQGLPTLVLVGAGDEELLRITELKGVAALTAALEPHLSNPDDRPDQRS